MNDDAERQSVVAGARALVERRLAVGSVGNVSARAGEGFLVTPTRVPHLELEAGDLVHLDSGGCVLSGTRSPSLEWPLHAAVYQAREDVRAIVHAHSPQAAAWSCVADELRGETEDFAYYGIDTVPVSRHAPPGSGDLGAAVVEGLGPAGRAVLMRRHGTVAVAATVAEAVVVAEVVEHQAIVAWLLRSVPGAPV